ncbi:hypothetical protein [Zobellia nedashkovskayae]|uniref:hypothetical protein n=1 Tax=Zobellia nedashkovskayae TaxID=2779510 RepID=UPI00188A3ACB|nr:hypothetical protein [Zobellia nedashkovskayae]
MITFDNKIDPYQLNNLVGNDGDTSMQDDMEKLLSQSLEYIKKRGYLIDETGTVPYTN